MQKNSHLYFVTSFNIYSIDCCVAHFKCGNVSTYKCKFNGLILLLDFANKILEKWNRLAKNTGLIYNVILFKKLDKFSYTFSIWHNT